MYCKQAGVFPRLFELQPEDTQTFLFYLRWFLPFLVFQSFTALFSGLLIQWRRNESPTRRN